MRSLRAGFGSAPSGAKPWWRSAPAWVPRTSGLMGAWSAWLGMQHGGKGERQLGAGLSLSVAVQLNPSTKDLPGGQELQTLTNGLGGWALMFSLAALVVGAAIWALGSHSQNYQQSYVGRRTVLVSALAALLIGAAPILINFFYDAGTKFH